MARSATVVPVRVTDITRSFHYPVRALLAAYAAGGAGTALSLGVLAFAEPAPAAGGATAAVALLFSVYFARTVCRQLTQLELDDAGLRARGPLAAAIRWEDLRSLRLDYFSTRADREGGWMQLRLRDSQRTIRVDSELEGFAVLVRRAAREAERRGLALDAATAANLAALERGAPG